MNNLNNQFKNAIQAYKNAGVQFNYPYPTTITLAQHNAAKKEVAPTTAEKIGNWVLKGK